MFMAVVDFTIVNVSLPRMAQDLKLGEDALQWVVIGYGVPFGGMLLLGGRLGDILGRRLILQAGLVVFTAASLTAGLSGSGGQLIAARVAQGVGAALITPSALGIVADTFKQGKERDNALGIYGALAGTAASVGVLAGGFLTDGPGWSWIFYVNVPIGVFLIAASMYVLPENPIPHPGASVDAQSALAVTVGLVSGLYGLNRGVVHGWGNSTTLASFAVAAVLLIGFVVQERRTGNPLVPKALLRNRPVLMANVAAASGFGSFMAFVFLTSVTLQQYFGYSATRTGVAWLATTVTGFFFAGLTGAVLAQKVGARLLLGIASVLVIVASVYLMFLPEHAPFASRVLPALLAAGACIGFFAPSVQIAALTNVSETHFGASSGLIETTRELGAAVVIAGASTALLDSKSGFLHGAHVGYGVIAIAAVFGVITSFVPLGASTDEQVAAGESPVAVQATP